MSRRSSSYDQFDLSFLGDIQSVSYGSWRDDHPTAHEATKEPRESKLLEQQPVGARRLPSCLEYSMSPFSVQPTNGRRLGDGTSDSALSQKWQIGKIPSVASMADQLDEWVTLQTTDQVLSMIDAII